MNAVLPLLDKVDKVLNLAGNIVEECYRMTVTGNGVCESLAQLCIDIDTLASNLSISCPILKINGATLLYADQINDHIGVNSCEWTMILSKSSIITEIIMGRDFAKKKDNVLYFTEAAALQWVQKIDPFAVVENEMSPSFENDTIIWIAKSNLKFGGNAVSVLPILTTEFATELVQADAFPVREDINELVKINANEMLRVRPEVFNITWGDKNSDLAKSFMLLAIKSLIATFCYELKKTGDSYFVTFKGTKSITASLDAAFDVDHEVLLNNLSKTVRWIYNERNETRQQLVMDRLSLDIISGKNFYNEIFDNLPVALQQSQDSYAFVILDRKDAYHKEMRELLKDMRSQADMYASKVRDIVNNITRDMLGAFAFVGYSFLGKFDKKNLSELINSHELSLLVRFLAGYLLLSCIMQLVIHLRDSYLTSDESVKWLRVLQRYTSREENTESFLEPIRKRKRTLYWSLGLMSIVYISLAVSIYKLPTIITFLLS